MKRKLLAIEWDDAWSVSVWAPNGTDKCEPAKIVSVGFLTEKNEHGYLIAARVDGMFDNVGDRQFIPHGVITKVRVLK